MYKIIKLIFVILFLFISNTSRADIDPPFNNIIISKNPLEYKKISFRDFEGNILNLKDQKSQIYILNFWATWCLPCREEMPYLDDLQKFEGINVYPINIEKVNKKKNRDIF